MQDRKLGDRIEKQVRLQLERENSEAIVDHLSVREASRESIILI